MVQGHCLVVLYFAIEGVEDYYMIIIRIVFDRFFIYSWT